MNAWWTAEEMAYGLEDSGATVLVADAERVERSRDAAAALGIRTIGVRYGDDEVPAEFGVEGYVCRYERHVIYWRRLSNGDVGIVTILHERMHQVDRFREDFGR